MAAATTDTAAAAFMTTIGNASATSLATDNDDQSSIVSAVSSLVTYTKDDSELLLPSGEAASVYEVIETLKQILPVKGSSSGSGVTLKTRSNNKSNAFTGKQAVAALVKHYNIRPEEAVNFGDYLQDRSILRCVGSGSGSDKKKVYRFASKSDLYFRLSCHASPEILNSYRPWTEPADPDSMRLIKKLCDSMNRIEKALTDDMGRIDYKNVARNALYPTFEDAVCEIQMVDLNLMDDDLKTAFGINLYNLMIRYAFMKIGYASSDMGRMKFFSRVKFNVGGHAFSFNEWEHGILRGNKKSPLALHPPIKVRDPRAALVVKHVDARIHFGLNCGAKSCPPIRYFTAERLNAELAMVAEAFCSDDDNVCILEEKKEVRLSKIFSWYRVDFCDAKSKLPVRILDFLPEHSDKKERLRAMILNAKENKIKVNFLEYDWSVNAKEDDEEKKNTFWSMTVPIVTRWKYHTQPSQGVGVDYDLEVECDNKNEVYC